jgi:uncharacterized tellurite resistance protein B-like protein
VDAKGLLHRILHAFDAPEPTPLPEPDEKTALGALMVRVAQSDHRYKLAEISRIDRLLSRLFGLGAIDAAKMRATCEKLAFAMEDDSEMAALVRDSVSYEHRLEKVEALWKVVMADGITDDRETALVDLVEEVLGVARPDSEAARASAVIP